VNALGVLKRIIESHQLFDATFTLIVHPAAPGWRQRHRTTEQRIDHMLDDVSDGGLATLSLPGRELADWRLVDLEEHRQPDGDLLSICSRFEVAGDVRHLALMDLHPEEFIPHRRLDAAVRSLCGGRPFWLLRTDRHHHVYGDFTMDEREWRSWNARFQMPAVLVDAHYVGRSLQLGYNTLRLNAGSEYQCVVPTVVHDDPPIVRGPMVERAIRLALSRQSRQLRKSGEPTVHHLREVAELAVSIHGECLARPKMVLPDVSADELYACGYLHDSIEDSATDYEDVVEAAGHKVAEWVCKLSEDKRLPADQRHDAYEGEIAGASDGVQIVKLADLLSNLRGIRGSEPLNWIGGYLDVAERQLGLLHRALGRTTQFREASDHLVRARQWLLECQRRDLGPAMAAEAFGPSAGERR
jgi:hypothetical protein